VSRAAARDGRRRSEAPEAERRPASTNAIARLQRAAGNRAVGRILARAPTGSIKVRGGSKLKASDFVGVLKRNEKVPKWLKSAVSAKGDEIQLSGELKPPSDKIWLFDESFAKAFSAGSWEITTAKATIEVTRGKDGLSWRQLVVPDLGGERIGTWMKTGPDDVEFSAGPLFSQEAEAIYGWTNPSTQTNKDKTKRDLILVVTEIEVTNPDGKKKTFTPGPDQVAEAIIHEIGIHAGRISAGLPDVHDGSAVIREASDQIGGFFRKAGDAGGLEPGSTSKEIMKFVGAK
jgi:hypothetical protein